MTVLGKVLGTELQVEGDTCAFHVSPDENGAEGVTVIISNLPEQGIVAFYADLGNIPEVGRERFYWTLLTANNHYAGTGGATLSIASEEEHVKLECRHNLVELANDAETRIVPFVETALEWRRLVANYQPSDMEQPPDVPDALDATDASDTLFSNPLDDGFLRV